MKETKTYCDLCKKESEIVPVSLKLGDPYYNRKSQQNQEYELCEKCLARLGFIKRVVDEKTQELKSEPTTKDKLYDCFVALIEEIGIPVQY